ncbi:protein SIEVE ELEMENT OCCLUSION A-like [Macadamia integrifolia]|uniref:protein SIEVE ELEMENT OCCLUSION A-like n=1 Tax=Macadamia integrifolia TaxID=60698 RepID=UPI001C4EE9CD|nr:protein SIEVE ELEMENT OCCLUSION A-like [Macadamia integrifolia]
MGTKSSIVPLEKLKASTYTALFISDFKVQEEEFSSLTKSYKVLMDLDTTCFEVIWVPMMVDNQSATWTADNKRKVSNMGASMPWYWVYDPSTIKPSFLQRVKEEWHFQGVPILVILEREGYLTHTNALPMMEIWGPSAYPFTKNVEEQLHKGLSDAIDYTCSANDKPNMEKWVNEGKINFINFYDQPKIEKRVEEGKIICFYGSHNKSWITRFLQKMELIAVQTNFQMVITYVGTNKKKDELPSILTSIDNTRASFIKTKYSRVWSSEEILSFWHNLEMSKSPKKMKVRVPVRKEFISILSYDEDEDGWALIFCDSKQEIVKSSGNKLIESLNSFTISGSRIQEPKDFLRELNEGLRVKHATHQEHGKSMRVPATDGYPDSEWKFCSECESFMY